MSRPRNLGDMARRLEDRATLDRLDAAPKWLCSDPSCTNAGCAAAREVLRQGGAVNEAIAAGFEALS